MERLDAFMLFHGHVGLLTCVVVRQGQMLAAGEGNGDRRHNCCVPVGMLGVILSSFSFSPILTPEVVPHYQTLRRLAFEMESRFHRTLL